MKKIFFYFIIFSLIISIGFFLSTKKESKISPFEKYADLIPGTYRVGFTDLDQEVQINNLEITGKIPHWLSGTLFRNGPAKFTCGNSWVSNWFDGLTMIHAFTIDNGNVSYTNKFLRSDNYYHVKKTGKMNYAGFVQDPCKSIFKRLFSYFMSHEKKDGPKINNANVNIAKFTDHFVALTETPLPVEFDKKTLETLGVMKYDDEYPQSNIHDTAHPHYDPIRKEHLGFFTKFGQISTHNVFKVKDDSTKREIIGSYEVKEPSYMHSFGLTKNYAILTALPLVVNPLDLLKGEGFITNFKWKPELGTKFLVFDRINNKFVGEFKGEPFFAFHVVNSYEENNKIIIDIVTYPNSSEINASNFYHILNPKKSSVKTNEYSILKRFTINFSDKKVSSKIIFSDEQIELPRINYENYNTKDYNFAYAYAGFQYYTADKLIKINVKTGEAKYWQQENCYPGEPVFIPTPNSKNEDDGVVLSVILDANKGRSFLLIIDAKNFKEIARAQVPHHIPFGIHGQYYKKDGKQDIA